MISKQFHYQLRNSEKQAFVGPPDNMREHVLAAAKALKVGDWKKCIQYLMCQSNGKYHSLHRNTCNEIYFSKSLFTSH